MIQMIDESTGWAAGDGRLLRTVDAGNSWLDVTPPEASPGATPAVHFAGESNAWLAVTAGDGKRLRIYNTSDGGRTWNHATLDEAGNDVGFAFASLAEGWLMVKHGAAMGSMPVTIYRTADGGATWQRVSVSTAPANPNPGPGALPIGGIKTGIAFRDRSAGWLTMESRQPGTVPLWRSLDGGETWQQQDLPIPAGYREHQLTIYPPRFFGSERAVLPVTFVPGYATIFYASRDGGESWQPGSPVRTLPHRTEALAGFLDSDHGWAADGTELWLTADGGRAWQSATAAMPDGLLRVQFVTPQTGWALSDAGLWRTIDGGRNWNHKPVTPIRR